jgi:peptidoglycan/LPS O-acetylase OafA/YrhL
MSPTRRLESVLASPHLPALDAIRAVSVFLVILSHFGIAGMGSLGVNAFFVLSGFLITHLLLKEHESSGAISRRDFYLRRSLRIFPAFYVFLLVSLGLDYLEHDPRSFPDAIASALYVQNYRNAIVGHSNSSIAHSWSLAVEEQFYLLWPSVLIFLLPRGRAAIGRMLLAAIVVVLVWRCAAGSLLGLSRSWTYNAFDCRFDSIAVGCLLAVLVRDAGARHSLGRLAGRPYLPLATVAGIAAPYLLMPPWWQQSLGFTYEALLVAILLIQLVQLAGAGLWAWLQWRWVRYLGTISYSLYLYHQRGLGVGRRLSGLPAPAKLLVGCLAAVVLASGSYWIVERPLLKLKDRLGHRHESTGRRTAPA